MGYSTPALQFEAFPSNVILDCEQIFWRLRAEVSQITQGSEIDWDAFFDQLFEQLMYLDREHPIRHYDDSYLRQLAEEMAYGDLLIENNRLADIPGARSQLFSAILMAALHIKEQMLNLGAYYHGIFPYTFRTMISDGCLLFLKNERIYDSEVSDFGY